MDTGLAARHILPPPAAVSPQEQVKSMGMNPPFVPVDAFVENGLGPMEKSRRGAVHHALFLIQQATGHYPTLTRATVRYPPGAAVGRWGR